jgi:hypothetical protein
MSGKCRVTVEISNPDEVVRTLRLFTEGKTEDGGLKQEIQRIIENEGIEVEIENVGGEVIEDWPCISYIITYRKGKSELMISYHIGVGHVDWNKLPREHSAFNFNNDDWELLRIVRDLHARPANKAQWASTAAKIAKIQKVKPDTNEALAEICRDTKEAIETSFEEWAANFGYDPDGRKAEQVYRNNIEKYPQLLAIMSRDTLDTLAEFANEL